MEIRDVKTAATLFGVIALLALLPACRIGSGFDTADKQRNLEWTEPVQSAGPAQPTVEQLQSPPIVYLLVAG